MLYQDSSEIWNTKLNRSRDNTSHSCKSYAFSTLRKRIYRNYFAKNVRKLKFECGVINKIIPYITYPFNYGDAYYYPSPWIVGHIWWTQDHIILSSHKTVSHGLNSLALKVFRLWIHPVCTTNCFGTPLMKRTNNMWGKNWNSGR